MTIFTGLAIIKSDVSSPSTTVLLVGGVDLAVATSRLLLAPTKILEGHRVSVARDGMY